MSSTPKLQPVGTRLAGRLIGVSVSQADDLAQLGLPPDQVQHLLQALLVPLVSDGARIAYGGRIQTTGDNYTLIISDQLGETYRRMDQAPGNRPFVHVVAQHRWSSTPVNTLLEHMRKVAPYGEVWVTVDEGVALTLAASASKLNDEVVWQVCEGLSSRTSRTGRGEATFGTQPLVQALRTAPAPSAGASFTSMRRFLARHCDARIMVGGRKTDFSGAISGLCEEALMTIEAGRPLIVLGGGGGSSRDIAAALGLIDNDQCVPRTPQADEHKYVAGLKQLKEARPAFTALFPEHVWPELRELAATESLMDAPELFMALLANLWRWETV